MPASMPPMPRPVIRRIADRLVTLVGGSGFLGRYIVQELVQRRHDVVAHLGRADGGAAFRAHQDAQPIVNLAALLPWPAWLPRPHGRRTRATAAEIRGLIAGLVGCFRGLTVRGGSKGLGTAVNETVVLCVVALYAVNVVLTTIGVRFGTGR